MQMGAARRIGLTFVWTMLVDELVDMANANMFAQGLVVGNTVMRAPIPLTSYTENSVAVQIVIGSIAIIGSLTLRPLAVVSMHALHVQVKMLPHCQYASHTTHISRRTSLLSCCLSRRKPCTFCKMSKEARRASHPRHRQATLRTRDLATT